MLFLDARLHFKRFSSSSASRSSRSFFSCSRFSLLTLPPEKRTFFSHFCPKNTHFSATSAQKTHVFQTLPPEKRTFFSQFHLKNARFSASST
jgi:hypothetical protein